MGRNVNVLMYRGAKLKSVAWIHVSLSVLNRLYLFWLIFLVGRKMVLLEILFVALNSLFQQWKRKILLDLAFAFLLNHAWISSQRVRQGKPLKATEHLFFSQECYQNCPSTWYRKKWLSQWGKEVEMFLGLCYECSVISTQEIEKLEKSELNGWKRVKARFFL